MQSISHPVGEIFFKPGEPLLKMWEVRVLPDHRPFSRHSHTRFEISLIVSGTGEYTTENRVYPMQPGDVFVFASGEAHCITRVCPPGIQLINLHFEPRYLMEHRESESFADFCFSHSPDFENRIPAALASDLAEFHTCLQNEFRQALPDYPTAIRAYLDLLLLSLIRNHGYQSSLQPGNNNLSPMLQVFRYIEEHLTEKITLEQLASVAGLSPNYFSHLFKQLNGLSLWDYITAKRVELAVLRILSPNSDLTVLEIALLCGFNNPVSFNRAFKKFKGVTPSELKKNPKLLSH